MLDGLAFQRRDLARLARQQVAARGVEPVELREFVAALVAGDAERAATLMDHHLDAVAERARIVPPTPRERDLARLLAPYVAGAGRGA